MLTDTNTIKINKAMYITAIGWTFILFAKFIPILPQPEIIIGYLWKPELLLSAFLFIAIVYLWKTGNLANIFSFGKHEFYFIILPLMLFVSWSGISAFWAISPRNAIHHTLLWACYLVFYILIRQITANQDLKKQSLLSLGFVISLLSLICFIEYIGYVFGGTYSDIGSRYSKFGELCVTILPIFLVGSLHKIKKHGKYFSFFAFFAWILIQCSFGRTQLLLGIASLIAIFGFSVLQKSFDKNLKRTYIAILSIAIIVQILSFTTTNQTNSVSRLINSNDELAKTSLNTRPIVFGISFEIFKQNPILGVGGDNFILAFEQGREKFSALNPNNKYLNVAEDVILERSHNEYLQILSELGIVGFIIFGWFLFGIFSLALNLRKIQSIQAFASIIGIGCFLISSFVTSFSFRVPANALVFFFVLSIAVKLLARKEKLIVSVPKIQTYFAFSTAFITICLMIFSAIRGTGLMYQQFAQNADDELLAEQLYKTALFFDKNEPSINYEMGSFLKRNNRFDEAIPFFETAIDNGICSSAAFYDLAATQQLAQFYQDSENTLAQATKVYPRSVFIRTAYSAILKRNNHQQKAQENLQIAKQIDETSAKTWSILQLEGLDKITQVRLTKENLTLLPDLYPQNGMFAVIDFQNSQNLNISRRIR